jgi:hypothetical protein
MSENVLKMPEGVSSQGMVTDVAEAYAKSVIAIPEILSLILEEMVSVSDSLSVLAIYAEKKGLSDGILGPDDIKGDEEDEPEVGKPN